MTAFLFLTLRYGIWLIRWLLYAVYGIFQFISKPGSRSIAPVMAAGATCLWRSPLEDIVNRFVLAVDWQHMPTSTLYPLAAIGAAALLCVYLTVRLRFWRVRRALRGFGGLLRVILKLAVLALVVGLGLAWYGYRLPPEYARAIDRYALAWSAVHLPKTAEADAILVTGLLLATCAYCVASRVLSVILGALPPITRPLIPLRRLAVRNRVIRPVAVRVVAPKLPPRRAVPQTPPPRPPLLIGTSAPQPQAGILMGTSD